MADPPVGPAPEEFIVALDALVEALKQINLTLQQIGNVVPSVPRTFIREQRLRPLMPNLTAGQSWARDGDKYPRGV